MKIIEIINQYQNNKYYNHLLLLQTSYKTNPDIIYKQYFKSILSFYNHDELLSKIDNNSYHDLIVYDCLETIKKEQINYLINQFQSCGLEKSNLKFFVIKNIDKIPLNCANALLKFIEDPPLNTYGIFFFSDINAVLSTIKSRSNFLFLNDDNLDLNDLNDKINTLCDLSINDNELINFVKSINDLSLAYKLIVNNDFILIYNFYNWIINYKINPIDSYFNINKNIKNISYNHLIIVLSWIKEKFNNNFNIKKTCLELISKINLNFSKIGVISILLGVLEHEN